MKNLKLIITLTLSLNLIACGQSQFGSEIGGESYAGSPDPDASVDQFTQLGEGAQSFSPNSIKSAYITESGGETIVTLLDQEGRELAIPGSLKTNEAVAVEAEADSIVFVRVPTDNQTMLVFLINRGNNNEVRSMPSLGLKGIRLDSIEYDGEKLTATVMRAHEDTARKVEISNLNNIIRVDNI